MAGTLSVGNILLDSGSNNAPAIAATTSPTVGIVFPAANTIAFSTAGVERMRLDPSTATLALGTTASSGVAGYARIRMDGTTGTFVSLFANGTEQGRVISTTSSTALYSQTTNPLVLGTGGTEKMRIDSSGNIGIGGVPGSGYKFVISGNTTGAVSSFGMWNFTQFLGDVTTAGYMFVSQPRIENTAFNMTNLIHYVASGISLTGSATIGTQSGFFAQNYSFANNNYGFQGTLTVSSINASAMSNTLSYTILTAGNTDFTQIGATSNTVGEFFTASNVQIAASTTGTVYQNQRNLFMSGTAENRFQGYTIIDVSDSLPALRVTQRGGGHALLVEDSTNPDSTPFVINGAGQVIIGNDTAITAALTAAPTIFPQVQISGTTGSSAALGTARFSNDNGPSYLIFTKSRSTTVGTFGANVASGDLLGQISFTCDDGGRAIEAARIIVYADAAAASNSTPGRIVFSTTPSGSNAVSERMRIDSVGYVGISTTTADANLSVGGVASFSDGTVSAPSIAHKGDLNCGIYFPAADTIGFTTSGTEAGRFDSTGNFTITNPAAKTGYGTGAGGTVTQLTNKSTSVTLNKPTGQITMNNASMAASSNVTFLLNNTLIAATDIIAVSSAGFTGPYVCSSGNVAAGSCGITVQNLSGSTLSDALKINFAVIKGVTA